MYVLCVVVLVFFFFGGGGSGVVWVSISSNMYHIGFANQNHSSWPMLMILVIKPNEDGIRAQSTEVYSMVYYCGKEKLLVDLFI